VGRIAARAGSKLPGTVVVGAHYDHLGLGGRFSLAPDRSEVHPGADDNASGVAAILEAARGLSSRAGELRRDVIVVAFSGEESGILGSSAFIGSAARDNVVAMLHRHIVGRSPQNRPTLPT